MMTWLSIALGGAVGALTRVGINQWFSGFQKGVFFPWATITVNILGAFILGFVVGISKVYDWPFALRLGITGGFLGALTTFSTFSLDIVSLFEREWWVVLVYVGASVLGGVCAVFLGLRLSVFLK